MNRRHHRRPVRHLICRAGAAFYAIALQSGRNYAAVEEQEIRRQSDMAAMQTYAWIPLTGSNPSH